jgi:hypothetical protein
MMRNRIRSLLLIACFALCATSTLLPAPGRAELEPVTRVLLVGNSYTHFHSLSRQIERLAASSGTPLRVDAVTHGGYSLRMHWMKSAARARIASGGYRYVVLQDHSLRPVDHRDEFDDYGQRFARLAADAGAKPVLYQTWPRAPRSRFYIERGTPRSADEMAAQLDRAYSALAARQGALLAPVGRAFSAALAAHPELELYGRDGTHPSWAGSYLAACVLYGTLTGRDPRSASYVPWELPAEQAPALRALAAKVLDGQRVQPEPSAPLPAPAPPSEVALAPPYLSGTPQAMVPDAPAAEAATVAEALTAVPAGTAVESNLDGAPFTSEPPAPTYLDDVECNDDLAPVSP